MSNGIRPAEVVRALRRWEGDVDELEQDPRLAGTGVARADLDRDGRIAGDDELEALARRMDESDGRFDGRIDIADDDGDATGAAPVLEAISEAARSKRLRELALAREGVPRPDRGVVFVGMNDTARAEASALRRHSPVILVEGESGPELGSPAEIRAFAAGLKLTDATAARVAAILEAAEPPARPALAKLARVWSVAERGGSIPARMVVSGHGNGEEVWGDPRRALSIPSVIELARAMPRAAGQIRALNLASCNHGHRGQMEDLLRVFPGLDSIWGYAGFSPADAEARSHLRIWDRQTRPLGRDGEGVDRSGAGDRPRGENVRVWTRRDGFDGPNVRELRVIRGQLADGRGTVETYIDGRMSDPSPTHGFLADHNQLLQEAVNHPDFRDLPKAERDAMHRELALVSRLRYFSPRITSLFDRERRGQIERGYAALRLRTPRFGNMSRAEALAEIRRFEEALRRHQPPPAAALELHDLLTRGLRDLSPDIIRSNWL